MMGTEYRYRIEKGVVAFILTVCWLFAPVIGYGGEDTAGDGFLMTVLRHLVYPLSHANIWHLLGNLFVLWLIKGRLWLLQASLIGFLCSWLPAFGIWGVGMTVGFSGILFAIVGIKWGQYCQSWAVAGRRYEKEALSEFIVKVVPIAVIGIVIPHVNWCIHLYCVLAGFLYGRFRR